MRILVHFPTRERPEQFSGCLAGWVEKVHDNDNTAFLVSLDTDDPKLQEYRNIAAMAGESKSKIHAINRDVDNLPWDVLVVASDDLLVKTHNFDREIRKEFEAHFPNVDGILWCRDGFNSRICCHPIMGRTYYNRFGYVFHPSYKSFFCDDEATRVATKLKKIRKTDKIVFAHQHPSARTRKVDNLDRKNKLHFNADKNNFLERARLGFP